MTEEEVQRQCEGIVFQKEILRLLHKEAKHPLSKRRMSDSHNPLLSLSLFCGGGHRLRLVSMVLVVGGNLHQSVNLARNVMELFGMDAAEVYTAAAKQMAEAGSTVKLKGEGAGWSQFFFV